MKPKKPEPKQLELLLCPASMILFGGARGGGKSYGLLLDYINHHYRYKKVQGMLIRRSTTEMRALLRDAMPIFTIAGFSYNEGQKTFTHPGGSTLELKYMDNDADITKWQGYSIQWEGLDEVGDWKGELENGIPICDRFRKTTALLRSFESNIPIRMIVTANPAGKGQDWIKQNWHLNDRNNIPINKIFEEDGFTKCYIPSLLEDNPYNANDPRYTERLKASGSKALVKAWREADWWTNPDGNVFKQNDFRYWTPDENNMPKLAPDEKILLRYQSWDTAFKETQTSDYSVGYCFIKTNLNLYVMDMVRGKMEFPKLKDAVKNFQSKWQADAVEVEDKASGPSLVQELKASTNMPIKARKIPASNLIERANFCLPIIEANKVLLPPKELAPWLDTFWMEMMSFPNADHDDIVSALLLGIEKFKDKTRDWVLL